MNGIQNIIDRYPNCKTMQTSNTFDNKSIASCLNDINTTGGLKCPDDYNVAIDFLMSMNNGMTGGNTPVPTPPIMSNLRDVLAQGTNPQPTSILNFFSNPTNVDINALENDDDYYNALLESSTFLRNFLNQEECLGGVYNNKFSQANNFKLSQKAIDRLQNVINRLTHKHNKMYYKDFIIILLIILIVAMAIYCYNKMKKN